MDGSCSGFEQTSNVGTARYMAPEVHEASSKQKARYSVQADVFSVGMVHFFVFEGRPPSLEGCSNPEEHFAALARGKRPTYIATRTPFRKIIDLCLRAKPSERPSSKDLVLMLKGNQPTPAFSFFPSAEERAERAALEYDLRVAKEVYEKVLMKKSIPSGSGIPSPPAPGT